MITGLDHVHIVFGNVEEGAKYFETLFGGQVVSRGEWQGQPVVRIDIQGSLIALMGTSAGAPQLVPGKGNRGLDHFGFKVKDFDQTMADLKKKGAKFSVEPSVAPSGVKYAFLEGPEGIRIELLEKN